MKNKLYYFLVAGTALMMLSVFVFAKEPVKKIPPYQERQGEISLSAEWVDSKKAIQSLISAIQINPADSKSMIKLAQAYIQESRVTGNHGYYDGAAIEILDNVLEKEPANFDALCCKATVLLSQHHFLEGLEVAQKAMPLNPYNAYIYGLLCDANLELGNYEEAVKMADKMMSIRPDIRSYARVSYLREIHGDCQGAIDAMKLAAEAGYPGLEQTEWTRCVLGQLYESQGKYDYAESVYQQSLEFRPDYAFALAGMGRVQKSKGDLSKAIFYFEKADGLVNEASFKEELTDLYLANNEIEKSQSCSQKVIAEFSAAGKTDEGEEGHGHYADKELAYAYLKAGNIEKALEHANIEYQRRPKNIEACETLAWVNYKSGQTLQAQALMEEALKTHSKNPVLLLRAAAIKLQAGDKTGAEKLIKDATTQNPGLRKKNKKELIDFLS